MQAGLRRNDGAARIKAIRLPVCVYRFVVIPAKAGIQWFLQYLPASAGMTTLTRHFG